MVKNSTEKSVPDIYIIGAQKSGTTTLFDWLAQHPDIYGNPLSKDYPFFSSDTEYKSRTKIFYSFARKAEKGQKILGGDANAMFVDSGAARMHEIMPSAKLLVILRNPVARAFSAYCYAIERGLENRSFEKAIDDEIMGVDYEPKDALQRDYLAHGLYAQQLIIIHRFFKSSKVKVVIFEELRSEPIRVMRDIFNFVGINENFEPNMDIKNKTKGGYHFKLLAKLVHSSPSSGVIRVLGRKLTSHSFRTKFRRILTNINRTEKQKPKLSDSSKKLLIEYYDGEIRGLESLLGKKNIFCTKG